MAQPASNAEPFRAQNPSRTAATLVVGLLLGACLGPALFLAVDRIEVKGDVLLSFAIGAFLTLGACLVIGAVTSFLILPRVFANARGTLADMIEDLTQASRAHGQGDTDKALLHVGQAIREGAVWYSIGATRRFAVQAALGLLISFGGSIGAVLLFNQNALLRDQNKKIDEQVRLLGQQNDIADSQKRGAFVTEMFSILQEVSREIAKRQDGSLPRELVTRIAVLTASAVPYRYLSRADANKDNSESVVLSPERGQILIALARMRIKIADLTRAGADFDSSDLRGLRLSNLDFSGAKLTNSDFSFADLFNTSFVNAKLDGSLFAKKANLVTTNFTGAELLGVTFEEVDADGAIFNNATLYGTRFNSVSLSGAMFNGARYAGVQFLVAKVARTSTLPKGLPWPDELLEGFERTRKEERFILTYVFPSA